MSDTPLAVSENVGRIIDEVMTVLGALPRIDVDKVPLPLRPAFDRTNLVETAAQSIIFIDALDRAARRALAVAQEADGIV